MQTLIARCLLLCSLLLVGVVTAQETAVESEYEVYVTTQDLSSFRVLPSTNAERLAVIPPATTLRAYGRTARTDWIQVEYNGEFGWVASWLLVWSGRVIELPIDGVNPPDFVRRTVVFGETFRDTPIYVEGLDPSTRVGTLPPEVQFEVTGYVGSGELYWMQINYEGNLYWVGSWDVHIIDGQINRTLNGGYLYVYGRANTTLQRDVDNVGSSLVGIEDVWLSLRNGRDVSCSPLPRYAVRGTADRDLEREPIFTPVAIALDDAIVDINATISRFEDICTSDAPFVTIEEVNTLLNDLNRARRNVTLAQALLNELSDRDPLVN